MIIFQTSFGILELFKKKTGRMRIEIVLNRKPKTIKRYLKNISWLEQ